MPGCRRALPRWAASGKMTGVEYADVVGAGDSGARGDAMTDETSDVPVIVERLERVATCRCGMEGSR